MKSKTRQTKVVRLQLPQRLYRRVEQAAQAARCDVSDMILSTLETRLPPLPGHLPPALVKELAGWATLDDAALRAIASAFLPPAEQRRFSTLLRKSQADRLSPRERDEWAALQQEYLRVSQNKAKAQFLLARRAQSGRADGAVA